jgi:hypothetical protein
MSFSESMDVCLRTSLPFIFIALTFFAVSLSKASQGSWTRGWLSFLTGTSQKSVDFNVNDLMLGTQDPFLWFLVPLFGVISVGICIAGNYLITILMHVFAFIYGWARVLFGGQSDSRYVCSASHIFSHCDTIANRCFSRTTFATTGGRQRLITTAILLLLITTLIPYQFAYMVLTIVQLCTCVRALRLARDTHSGAHYNFYNYATSMLVLMLWVLPINMPVLIVWIHNLAVHWLTPFSTHHNLLAVLPLVLLVEVMSAGNMTPRVTGRYVAIHSFQCLTRIPLTLAKQSTLHNEYPDLPFCPLRRCLRRHVRLPLTPPPQPPRRLALRRPHRLSARFRRTQQTHRRGNHFSHPAVNRRRHSGEGCEEDTLIAEVGGAYERFCLFLLWFFRESFGMESQSLFAAAFSHPFLYI